MAQYNLNRNYALTSLTTSGTGNTTLNWSETDMLVNGDTSVSGITLTASDILYLETDLTDRLKVDGIDLYMSSLSSSGTVLSHIDFYYKNSEADSFSLASKGIDIGGFYYATIPTPSAPRYVRVTVSGLASTLYEYIIYNDDYLVAYGEDGSLHRKYLERATIGTQGTATVLPIFNNNIDLTDPTVDAYTCVDYSGEDEDYYLKLSSSETGTYYGLDDGGLIEDDDSGSNIRWSYGTFADTEIDGDSVILSPSAVDFELNDLPSVLSTNGWRCAPNCWVWDKQENRIFCMASDSGPQLKLWEYYTESNTYLFLTLINPTGPTDHLSAASMTYIDGKVYVCMNIDGKFGYYDLSGPINNWTDLADIPEILSNLKDKIGIIGDQERYIYALCASSSSPAIPAPNTSFHRYDTISGTVWEDLDNTIKTVDFGNDWGVICCLTYDWDRNCIYLISMDEAYNVTAASDWIQKYDIAANTWNNTFYRLADNFSAPKRHKMSICYHNDYIYFFMISVSANLCYKLNLITHQVESYNFLFASAVGHKYILVIDSYNTDGVYILVTNANIATTKLFGYGLYSNYGTYTTPVFSLTDGYMSSYFLVESTTNSNNNISWDNSIRNGTVMHRSSDTEPLPVLEWYWPYIIASTSTLRVRRIVTYTEFDDLFISFIALHWRWSYLAVDQENGVIAGSMYYSYGGNLQSQIRLYDRTGAQTHTNLDTSEYTRNFSKMKFESDGGLWAYCPSENNLYHFNSTLSEVATKDVGTSYLDFVVETGSDGVWYITSTALMLLDYNGNQSIYPVTLSSPSVLCETDDGGVWVVVQSNVVYRYSNSGATVNAISLARNATLITRDYTNGFWYSDGYFVAYVTANGQEVFNLVMPSTINHIVGGKDCCMAYSVLEEKIYHIDRLNQSVTREFSSGVWDDTDIFPDLLSYDLDMFYENGNIEVPPSFDPVWDSTTGSLEWNEIQLNGGFLPKHRFHQLDIKLQTNTIDSVPSLDKVIMAPATKLSGISSQTSRDLYIKTDVPVGANVENYETKLRTWWSVIDA